MQIKRVMKLYNNKDVPKRGDTNYNPSYKLDLIYNHIVHNINSITKWANLEKSGDNNTLIHGYMVALVKNEVA